METRLNGSVTQYHNENWWRISQWNQLYTCCCCFSVSSKILHVNADKLFYKSIFFPLDMKVPMDGLIMPNWLSLAGRWQPPTWTRLPPGPTPSSPLSSPRSDETRWPAWTLRRCVYSSKTSSSVTVQKKMSLINEICRSVRSAWWTWREVSGLTPRGRRELGWRWQIYQC